MSICTEKIPKVVSRLSSPLNSIIDCSLHLNLVQSLSLRAYKGLISFDWCSFALQNSPTVADAWKLAYQHLEHLYQTLRTIPEAIFCIATLEVKDSTGISVKRKRNEETDSDTLLAEHQNQNLEYGMPQIRFLLFCTTKDGTTRDWREIQKIVLEQKCFPVLKVSLVDPKGSMAMENALKKSFECIVIPGV
jgi:hypothetical protein